MNAPIQLDPLNDPGPQKWWREPDALLNEKNWRLIAQGGDYFLQLVDDSNVTTTDAMRVTRTGMVVDNITFGGPINAPTLMEGGATLGSKYSLATHNHTGVYAPLSHTHDASAIVSGVLATARLGTGTPDGTKYLRDDGTWQTPAGGGGGFLPLTGGTLTGQLNINAVAEHIRLYDSNSAQPLDAFYFELNDDDASIYGWDNSAASYRRFLACKISTGAITIGSNQTANPTTISTSFGNVYIGPENTSATHFRTDRALFYFDKPMQINDQWVVVDNDARLSNARPPTAHTHAASDITSGLLATNRMGTGTADSTTFLRGDGTWQPPSATGGSALQLAGTAPYLDFIETDAAAGAKNWRIVANSNTFFINGLSDDFTTSATALSIIRLGATIDRLYFGNTSGTMEHHFYGPVQDAVTSYHYVKSANGTGMGPIISRGTAAPSGGADGDTYYQYT